MVLGLLVATECPAVQVRLATYNVLFGVGTPGSAEYLAVRSILQRVNPDIIGFQELLNTDYENWVTLAADLGYPYIVYGPSYGPLTGSQRLGFFSRYPVKSSAEVTEYPGATELTRYPLRVTITVPGALNPFSVYTVHLKASSGSANQFRRAIEGRRVLSNLVTFISNNPLESEYAIIGDFNEDVANSQTTSFSSLPTELPSSYTLGPDVLFPVIYRLFPTDRFTAAGLQPLTVRQEDSTSENTYSSGGRLDYLLFSEDIRENPYGAPVGEIYNSTRDDGVGGLPKFGNPLPSTTSATASDHFLVFTDFNMIDVLPCVNPVLFISEIADHPTAGASYIELFNSGSAPLSVSNYAVVVYIDGVTPVQIPFSATVAAGKTFVIAANAPAFQSAFPGKTADLTSTNLLLIDGNDVVALRNANNRIIDIFGVPGEPAGSNDFTMDWAYPTSRVMRLPGISDPYPAWSASEWVIGSITSGTPGSHDACDNASVYFDSTTSIPSAPGTGDLVRISASAVPNFVASNLALTAHWTINNGALATLPMTKTTNGSWQTATFFPGATNGSLWTWYVTAAFSGPGAGTVTSGVNQYTFPLPPITSGSYRPRFNEVEPDDASTDDREFIELIGPAGLNLTGYRIAHHNGSDTQDALIWNFVIPSFVIPDDGIVDIHGTPLGFCILSTPGFSAQVANVDINTIPSTMQNGPDALILYDPSSNIVDAITWGGAGDTAIDDPGTVVTNGNPEANNFLHQLTADTTDNTHQAPNNVLGDPGSGWRRTVATPGAINIGQTSGYIRIRGSGIGDQDLDSFADDIDNCPDVFNPIQTDLDNDGIGDACDPDRDGDTIPDLSDNCPSTLNHDQYDLDGDSIGDACDPDRDNDGIENDEDLCPDASDPLQADLDGDGVGDLCDTDDDGDGIPDSTDNCPAMANPLQQDLDADGIGDICDADRDGDGVPDISDNCPINYNPQQTDGNSNGIGDACEQDSDLDGVPDLSDNCPNTPNANQLDNDGDGTGDACDSCTGSIIQTNLITTGFSAGIPAGWSIITNGQARQGWRFDDPLFRGNRTGGTGLFAIVESAISLRNAQLATELRSRPVDLRNVSVALLSFKTFFDYRTGRSNEVADVDISTKGASGPWSNVWRRTTDASGQFTIDISAFAGSSNVMIRFNYYNAYQEYYWQIDDVLLACQACTPPPDTDGDGIPDPIDNCPSQPNANQSDLDLDGLGDVCDADRDGDGLPDAWELQHFANHTGADAALDSDYDGVSNGDEFIAGTDPTNAMSRLTVETLPSLDSLHLVLIPETATGRLYSIQWHSGLNPEGGWQDGGLQKTGTGAAVTFSITNGEPLLFYRAGATILP